MSPISHSIAVALLLLSPILKASPGSREQDWSHNVRIGAYGLRSDNADQIVRSALEDGVFGIEVDNDVPGRYESFVNPEEKLKAIREVAEKAHAAGRTPASVTSFLQLRRARFFGRSHDRGVPSPKQCRAGGSS